MVIHSYRHRFGLAPGEPDLEDTERRLTEQPRVAVPTIVLHGSANGVIPVTSSANHRPLFGKASERRVLAKVGHNLPQEAPLDFSAAVLSLI